MISVSSLIEEFRQREVAALSGIALAGTGPDGAIQVQILHELGDDYLRAVGGIDVISGGAFSFFIHVANQRRQFNVENFRWYERYVKERHRLPLHKKLSHLATMKLSKKSLYPNTHIRDTFLHLFDQDFGALRLAELDYPVTFHSYDLKTDSVIALSRKNSPDMALIDVARACVSVPPIHGYFDYQGMRLVDPIFSPSFASLRKSLFKRSNNLLFVNHKKTQKTSKVCFLAHSSTRYPDVRLFKDFALLYLGIPNRRITKSNLALLEKGIINGL